MHDSTRDKQDKTMNEADKVGNHDESSDLSVMIKPFNSIIFYENKKNTENTENVSKKILKMFPGGFISTMRDTHQYHGESSDLSIMLKLL